MYLIFFVWLLATVVFGSGGLYVGVFSSLCEACIYIYIYMPLVPWLLDDEHCFSLFLCEV